MAEGEGERHRKMVRRVSAPMVGLSDLPFRLLVRKHGASCAYTEMLMGERIASEGESYLTDVLHTCPEDRPLVVQLAGSCPDVMRSAAVVLVRHLRGCLDGICINLGCPQKRAQDEGYGAYLLDKQHWPTVFAMVRAMTEAVKVPILCKIRLCEDEKHTVAFALGLEQAGCKVLAVHGRKRGSQRQRRRGAASLASIREVKQALDGGIPVVSNGNISCRADVLHALTVTEADGVMSAEGLLENPALFDEGSVEEGAEGRGARQTDMCALAEEYLDLFSKCRHGNRPRPAGEEEQQQQQQQQEEEEEEEGGGTGGIALSVAKAHILWMLGKSGHGRSVRFAHPGSFAKHVLVERAVRSAEGVPELRAVVRDCLRGVFK